MYKPTPLIKEERNGSTIYYKMEIDQPSESFKIRGMSKLIQTKSANGTDKFVSSSGGNAGYSAAMVCDGLKRPITVVLPRNTKRTALEKIKTTKADIIIHGNDWQEAHSHATILAEEQGAHLIHPFDDPLLWEGHSTLIEECADIDAPDAIVVSVGGGGLYIGVTEGMKKLGWDSAIYACETTGAASMADCIISGKHVELNSITTIASSLGARKIADEAFRRLSEFMTIPHVVDDMSTIKACESFKRSYNRNPEPACGAALSGIDRALKDGHKSVLVIVCGGIVRIA